MQDPIQCRYRWTLEEFVKANEQNRRHSGGARRILWIFWTIALFLLFAGIVRTMNRHGFDRTSAMLLVGGTLLLASRLFHRRMLMLMFKKMPDRDSDVRLQISPDRVIIESYCSSALAESVTLLLIFASMSLLSPAFPVSGSRSRIVRPIVRTACAAAASLPGTSS